MIAKSFEIHLVLVNKVLKQMFKEKKHKILSIKTFFGILEIEFFPFLSRTDTAGNNN